MLTIGNAIAAGDVIDGKIRADAIAATNVVVKDKFPVDSDFISADGNPIVDNTVRELTWNIASLVPGQKIEYRLRFKKQNTNNKGCEKLVNSTYNVTSNEMPYKTGVERYIVSGRSVSVGLTIPLVIKSVRADPSKVIYGEQSTLSIVVQNFWDKAVNGAQLEYQVQSNAFYVPGSAAPNPLSAPSGVQPGGNASVEFQYACRQ